MTDVAPGFDLPPSVARNRHDIEAAIRQAVPSALRRRQFQHRAEDAMQQATVADNRDPFTSMLFREIAETINVLGYSFGRAFALWNHIIWIAAILLELLWKAVAHLLFGQPVENPKIALAQPGVDQNSVARACADDLSCLDGASEVTAVKPHETLAGQTLAESMGLLKSALGQFAVQMPLMTAIGIPDRLAMADDDEVCRRFQTRASYCTRMR